MIKTETVGNGKAMRFYAGDGTRLTGMLFAKTGREKSCIIYIHGMGGSMINSLSLSIARNASKDFAVFAFNNRGHDLVCKAWKIKNGKKKRFLAGFHFEKFEESWYDIKGAVEAMSKLGYKRIILCGHSTGCQKAIYYNQMTEDSRISAFVLLGPCDDYNLYIRELGRKYSKMLAESKRLVRIGKGNSIPDHKLGLSAQRLDSVLNLDRIEARLLNYKGDMKEYNAIAQPILAVFGSNEEYKLMPIRKYLEILDVRSGSRRFKALEIKGANHSFEGKEDELSSKMYEWLYDL